MKNIIFISKDALNKHALPVYGNKYWKTPNIDELAAKGTVFNRHYTAGASTAMAFTSMAIGKYCYETGRKYYKNEEATAEVFTEDGWFRTGDMGVLDDDGCLFIKGRTKCMILGPSGQNIYPEEVETVINSQPYVVDSLVIEDDGGLTALIYPDFAQGVKDGMSQEAFVKFMENTLPELNKELPNYAKLKKIEVMSEDFERTPKKSIKRYLYQR